MELETQDLRPTAEDVAESLNGFDEIAIERKFGADVSGLGATMSLRALAFTLHRRSGMKDEEAYRQAMQATLKDVTEMFAEKSDEGKAEGESESASTRAS